MEDVDFVRSVVSRRVVCTVVPRTSLGTEIHYCMAVLQCSTGSSYAVGHIMH